VDLFEGRTFPRIEAGVGYAGQTGLDTIIERGRLAAEDLPAELIYAGFSLGVLPAQMLAQTRPGARGALLLEACVPASEFGDGWPEDVPVQIHGMDAEPFFAAEGDLDAARELVQTAKDAELFLYPAIGTCSRTAAWPNSAVQPYAPPRRNRSAPSAASSSR
jgi:hypothetical protein